MGVNVAMGQIPRSTERISCIDDDVDAAADDDDGLAANYATLRVSVSVASLLGGMMGVARCTLHNDLSRKGGCAVAHRHAKFENTKIETLFR